MIIIISKAKLKLSNSGKFILFLDSFLLYCIKYRKTSCFEIHKKMLFIIALEANSIIVKLTFCSNQQFDGVDMKKLLFYYKIYLSKLK